MMNDPLQATIAALVTAAIIALITGAITAAVRSTIEHDIRSALQDRVKPALDRTTLIWYAGEAAAEEIARRSAVQAGLSPTPEESGRGVRYLPQRFEIVFVTDGVARVLVRQ